MGGMAGGFAMFVKDHKAIYDYNFLDGVHYILESKKLPTGTVAVKFNFIKTQEFGGKGYINGTKEAEIDMSRMNISTWIQ